MYSLLLAIIYIAFISLGLPDSVLGSAWPIMYPEFGIPVSCAGIITMIISAGTIVSSLCSDRLNRRLGTGLVTAISVGTTAIALFGFSVSHSFIALCLWAIPYGLGAGAVDAALNNYVALHYSSRVMSWLHCMWGVGTTIGPYIMTYALTHGQAWNMGYRYISILQIILTAAIVFSIPLWSRQKNRPNPTDSAEGAPDGSPVSEKALSLRDILRIPGAKEVLIMFFCYCALEQTALTWASSYLVLTRGIDSTKAASFASLFCIGITVGRAINGFLAAHFSDTQLTRLGEGIILVGLLCLLLPLGETLALTGLILVGLGCAPIYPCVIHSTPDHFGSEQSQAIIGVQMASAYIGILTMPPLFGVFARAISASLFPWFLLIILILMAGLHERLVQITA